MTFVAAAIGAVGGGLAAGSLGIGLGTGILGGAAIGGMLGGQFNAANAAKDAANAQVGAANNATALQAQIFDTINKQQAAGRSAQYGALNTLQSMLPGQYQQYDMTGAPTTMATGSGELTRMFTNKDLTANLAPNYEFMRNQGLGAVRQNINVGGGGSNANMAATKFAEDYAKGAYQDALNNWRLQQGDIYNRLAGVAQIGQTAQTATNQAGTNYANAAGQLGIGGATAYGAGQVGAANAMSGVGNNFIMAAMLPKLLG